MRWRKTDDLRDIFLKIVTIQFISLNDTYPAVPAASASVYDFSHKENKPIHAKATDIYNKYRRCLDIEKIITLFNNITGSRIKEWIIMQQPIYVSDWIIINKRAIIESISRKLAEQSSTSSPKKDMFAIKCKTLLDDDVDHDLP